MLTTPEYRNYRSFNSLNFDAYIDDLSFIKDSYSGVLQGDPNTVFNNFHNDITGIINKHIPMKKTKIQGRPAPFINKRLKCAIFLEKTTI